MRRFVALSSLLYAAVLTACGGASTPATPGTTAARTIEMRNASLPTGWSELAPMPTSRGDLGVGVVNGILYAVGGDNPPVGGAENNNPLGAVEAYDPSTNTWTTKAPLPTPVYGAGVAAVNNLLYVIGGVTNSSMTSDLVQIYNPATNVWTSGSPMPTQRSFICLTAVNGTLYAVGGYKLHFGRTSTVEAYDPNSNSWTTKASMPVGRAAFAMAQVNDKLYTIGDGPHVFSYDPSMNVWSSAGTAPKDFIEESAAAVRDRIYVVGGLRLKFGGKLGEHTFDAYTPSTGAWGTRPRFPKARYLLAAADINGVLYAVGGFGPMNTATNTLEAYRPK